MQLPAPNQFNLDIMRCKQALHGGRTVAIYKSLVDAAGSIKAAVFLSQLVYWTRHGVAVMERDGWIFKSIAEMEDETGLSKREQGTCKKKLLERNLIETRRFGFGARLEMRVNLPVLAEALCRADDRPFEGNLPENIGQSGDTTDTLMDLASFRQPSNLFFLRYFKERIAYHRDLVTLTGCIHSAIMLSFIMQQCVAKGAGSEERWFVSFDIPAWQRHLSLPYKTQLTARNKLKNLQFIIEKHFFASRRIFTLLNGRAIWSALEQSVRNERNAAPETQTAPYPLDYCRNDTRGNTAGPNPESRNNKRANTDTHFRENAADTDPTPVTAEPEARSNKRANTVVTKPENKKRPLGKLGSDRQESTESTKGRIVKDLDYLQFPIGNDYNGTPGRTGQAGTVADVGGVLAAQKKTTASDIAGHRFDGLIYPQKFGSSLKTQSRRLFDKLLPVADRDALQEILDEIAGQTKPVTSPLGLLTVLCRKAAAGELICILAPQVREKREQQQAWERQRLEQEQLLQKQAATVTVNDAVHNITTTEDLRRSVLRAVGIRSAENGS
jgi:hypothetical protein